MKRLAIISTHPIQYYAPIFRLLHKRGNIAVMVFYTWGHETEEKYDPGFGKNVKWDIPLLDGYPYRWVKNTASKPGSSHFCGIVNPDLTRQISDWSPDALLVFGWAYNGHLSAIRYFGGRIPVYFRGDSTLMAKRKGIENLLKKIFLIWLYKHINCAFYVGVNNKNYFQYYGLKENQLVFAPHAIDNDRFGADHSIAATKLRSSLGVRAQETLILFAGKFEPVKNVEALLNAFIQSAAADAHLLLVGNGVDEIRLKASAKRSRKKGRIHFMDFQNQTYMPVLYQAADLVCLPSISETWGLGVNEAMACGKAILVSDRVGCAIDLVKENYNGAIFRHNQIGDLIDKITQLANSKSILKLYGERSRSLINPWNFEAVAQTIESTLMNENKLK